MGLADVPIPVLTHVATDVDCDHQVSRAPGCAPGSVLPGPSFGEELRPSTCREPGPWVGVTTVAYSRRSGSGRFEQVEDQVGGVGHDGGELLVVLSSKVRSTTRWNRVRWAAVSRAAAAWGVRSPGGAAVSAARPGRGRPRAGRAARGAGGEGRAVGEHPGEARAGEADHGVMPREGGQELPAQGGQRGLAY